MDKASILAAGAIGIAVVVGAMQTWSGCAWSSQEAGDLGEDRPVRCLVRVAPGALVMLGVLALAGVGVAGDHPPVAWAAALLALGGSILYMFSLGWFVFPALAVCYVVGLWHVARRRRGRPLRGDPRLTPATAVACATFLLTCALYFWQPFTGLFLLVAAIAVALALLAFAVTLAVPRAPPAPPS